MLLVFLKAWLIGFAIAAPVGPIGVLCIRKTLELGLMGTFAVGIGAALADSLYGLVAATGLTALSSFLLNHAGHIKLLGGLLLLGIAYKEEHHPVPSIDELQALRHKDFCKILSEVVLLTLMNPLTIISYIGVFASIGNVGCCSIISILSIVCGIFCGALTLVGNFRNVDYDCSWKTTKKFFKKCTLLFCCDNSKFWVMGNLLRL